MRVCITKKGAIGLLACITLPACSFFADERSNEDFEKYVGSKKIGNSSDYWLVVRNRLGENERVALFFGYYTEDGTKIECENAIKGLSEINFDAKYHCEKAN
jgi:hypothetical protein